MAEEVYPGSGAAAGQASGDSLADLAGSATRDKTDNPGGSVRQCGRPGARIARPATDVVQAPPSCALDVPSGDCTSGSACAQVRPITNQERAHGVHGLHGTILVNGLDRHHRDVFVVR